MKIKIPVLLDTKHHLVCNKPPNVFAQPPENKALYTLTVQHHLSEQYPQLFPVHRLDQKVSGCLCFAKTKQSAKDFGKNLRKGGNFGSLIERKYLCLAQGTDNALDIGVGEQICVDEPIDSKPSSTIVQRLPLGAGTGAGAGAGSQLSRLFLVKLMTGRKHQIRIHLGTLGYTVVGDTRYGYPREEDRFYNQIALHAVFLRTRIGLKEYETFAPLEWNQSGVWDDLLNTGGLEQYKNTISAF